MVAINSADEETMRGLTGFKPYVDSRIVQPAMTSDVLATRLNPFQPYNRSIGIYGTSEVWVKPWALPNYVTAIAPQAGRKPLRYRQLGPTDMRGLRVASTISTFPLVAEFMTAYFGLATYNRLAGAVLYVGAGGAYTDPTL
jgi:hypothetical protein